MPYKNILPGEAKSKNAENDLYAIFGLARRTGRKKKSR